MITCDTTDHNYFPLSRDYYKENGRTTGLSQPAMDQIIAYTMLCCSKCGETKEVISADHRKKED